MININYDYLYFLLDELRLNEMTVKELEGLKRWIQENEAINSGVKECDIYLINEELKNR